MIRRRDLATLLRSTLAGGLATLVDLLVLTLCLAVGLPARLASVPALLAGGVANFFGNRHFAFRATSGSLRRQALLYLATEVIALALNGVLYDLALRLVHPTNVGAVALRLVTTNLVFMAFSYPLWRRVFRPAVAT